MESSYCCGKQANLKHEWPHAREQSNKKTLLIGGAVRCALIINILLIASTPHYLICWALDNGLARTPPMGWIAWERFTCTIDCDKYPNDCVNSQLFQQMADRLEADGWLKAGYEYVNIDDCWSELQRDVASQKLLANRQRFPMGMGELAAYMHSKGLKFGLYGDCGTLTCAGYPAQLRTEESNDSNYMQLDANQLAEWQVDSFKFDSCYLNPTKAESICPQMARALNATQRPMVLICEWPFYMMRWPFNLKVNFELVAQSCNAWRYYEDVEDSWLSVLGIIDFSIQHQTTILQHHGPGHWFDPDQLIIGNFALSLDQARAQMALWCLWSAPLYMGNDLRHIEPEMVAVLQNERLIGVDQDRLGVWGQLVGQQKVDWYQVQAFAKPVEPISHGCSSFVIVYLNRATLGSARVVTFPVRDLLAKAPIDVAAKRYASLYPMNATTAAGGPFDGEQCKRKLTLGMSRPPQDRSMLIRPRDADASAPVVPIEEQDVSFKVYDLFNEPLDRDFVNLNRNLTLRVNPSGVRVVKLVVRS